MPEFIARVGTSDGTVMERSFTADSEDALRADLAQREYFVFGIKRKSGVGALLPDVRGRRSIKMKEFLLFNQELAALLRAGLPILGGLDILLERRKNPVFRKALSEVRDKVRGGAALSEAFEQQGGLFPGIYSATLASGERSGEVANVLQRYIQYQKTVLELRRKIVSALIYPTVLFVLSIVVIIILITHVLPSFMGLFADFQVELPLLTRALLFISMTVTGNWLLILVALILLVIGFRYWQRSPAGRTGTVRLIRRIPIVGAIAQRFAASRFLRTLGTLVAGGIPAVTALGISARAVGNPLFEESLLDVEKKVREGGSLWQSLENTSLFNDITIEMTKVGESTGALSEMLTNAADFYDQEIDQRLSTAMVLIEPLMLIGMGVIVALIMLAIWLPLLKTYGQSQA